MKRQKDQGSESVNREPQSHTGKTRQSAECCAILLEIWKGPGLPQGKVAGAYMGLEFVFAVAILVEGAEETAVRFPKRFGLDAPGTYRSLYMGIVGGIADADDQLAGVKLNIFVSPDVSDFELSCKHPNKKASSTRDFNGDLNVVLGAT